MPFADPADYRIAHAGWFTQRYREDAKFRRAEAKRKADWYLARSSDPAWLAEQAAKKRAQRAAAKKIMKKTATILVASFALAGSLSAQDYHYVTGGYDTNGNYRSGHYRQILTGMQTTTGHPGETEIHSPDKKAHALEQAEAWEVILGANVSRWAGLDLESGNFHGVDKMKDDPDSKRGMLVSAIVAGMSCLGVLFYTGATAILFAFACIGSIVMLYRSAIKNTEK